MALPYQILDWYGARHTCHTAFSATVYVWHPLHLNYVKFAAEYICYKLPLDLVYFRTCRERDLLQVQMWYQWKTPMQLTISEFSNY